jgi:hypothetical protein
MIPEYKKGLRERLADRLFTYDKDTDTYTYKDIVFCRFKFDQDPLGTLEIRGLVTDEVKNIVYESLKDRPFETLKYL